SCRHAAICSASCAPSAPAAAPATRTPSARKTGDIGPSTPRAVPGVKDAARRLAFRRPRAYTESRPERPPKNPVSRASRTAVVASAESPRLVPHRSTMLERFGIFARLLIRLAFAHVRVRPELVERVRQLASQGTVIYVMRYRSAIDYLLVNAVLL